MSFEYSRSCLCIKELIVSFTIIEIIKIGDKLKYHKYSSRNLTGSFSFQYTIKNNTIILTEDEFNEHFVDEAKWRDKQIEKIFK